MCEWKEYSRTKVPIFKISFSLICQKLCNHLPSNIFNESAAQIGISSTLFKAKV